MLVVWIVLALVLLAVEAHHLAFYALFVAAGALAAAGVAVAFPHALILQVVVAVVVAILGIGLLRPYVSRVLRRRDHGPLGRGVHGAIVGEEVLTLDEVGDAHHAGHVRLAGERWLAVTEYGRPIPSDTRALVTTVRGTTLVVVPLDADGLPALEPPPGLPSGTPDPPPEQE